MAEQWTREQFTEYVERQYEDQASEVMRLVNQWLARGDGAAVYENQDLGHPQLGAPQITSFGSLTAQLEPECATCRNLLEERDGEFVHARPELDAGGHVPNYPPQRLPDIGNQINWRYQLIATYREEDENCSTKLQ